MNTEEGKLPLTFVTTVVRSWRRDALMFVLGVAVAAIFICLGFLYARSGIGGGIGEPKVDNPPPIIRLSKEDAEARLSELQSKLAEYRTDREKLATKLEERKRAYAILRNTQGKPADSPECQRLVKDVKILQGPVDLLDSEIAKLSGLESELQDILQDLKLEGFVELTIDTEKLVAGINDALASREIEEMMASGSAIIPDEVWVGKDPDEIMKLDSSQ